MKNFLFAALGGLLLLTSCARQNESIAPASGATLVASAVPAPAVATLQQNFPTATQVSWMKQAQQSYKALFQVGSQAKTARISANGTLLSAHDVIDPATLPAAVTDYLKATYAGYTIVRAEVSKDAAGTVTGYEVSISVNNQAYELEFDGAGKFLRQETEGGQDNGDKNNGDMNDGDHNDGMTIAQTALPAPITTYLDTNYKGYTFVSASVEKDKAGTVVNYEVKFTLNGKTYEAEFDASAKFLKLDD